MIPVPFNEQFRLAVLEHFNVLDTEPQERFDRITRLASRCFDVPMAVISLVDAERQWFMSSTRMDAAETPRAISFCGHAIMNQAVFVILDAAEDERFAKNPLVTGEPKIRFYAGAPLLTAKGFRLGTLCLIDQKPHDEFSPADRAALVDVAAMVMREMYFGPFGHGGSAATEQTDPPDEGGLSAHRSEISEFEKDAAQKAQMLFIASLSHELRTPLNAIMGFSDALQSELFGPIDNERYLEYARHINASGAHLTRFVDSVLDFARAEEGEVFAHDEWIDIPAIVRDCQTMFIEQQRKAEIQFFLSAPKGLPLLKADPQLVMHMLVNLVGNSIKFTEPGGEIHVGVELDADGGLMAWVADTGIGIASKDLQTCLVPFGQASKATTLEHSGFGLGLSLTRQFMKLHDGDLSIESEPGVGTVVRLHFPPYRVA